ncbi:MAG: hypothetical protein ACYDCL_04340 [Myxococcales bacterium]
MQRADQIVLGFEKLFWVADRIVLGFKKLSLEADPILQSSKKLSLGAAPIALGLLVRLLRSLDASNS